MTQDETMATVCRNQSRFIKVNQSRLHYLELGAGDPIVFLHGMPTSSYLWRNIMPSLSQSARCIAPDLIGMGKSDKPDIEYRIFDHIRYIEGFIQALDLRNVTLVLHGWGSVIGFDYASRHAKNIKALAFYESHIRPVTDWNMLSLPVQQLASLLSRPGASYRAVVQQNYLLKKTFPAGMVHQLTPEEIAFYEAPFPTPESRKPLWQYVKDLPIGTGPRDVIELIVHYSNWLQKTPIPKLFLYAVPGFITTMETVQWAKTHLSNLQMVCLDDVLHFAQETIPERFSAILHDWYSSLPR